MIRIDLIGAPGAGKTTLMNEMLSQNIIKNAVNLSHAKREVLNEFFSKEITVAQNIKFDLVKKVFGKNSLPYDKRKLKEFLNNKIEEYDDILSLILKNHANSQIGNSYLKFKRLEWFIRVLEDTLLVSSHTVNKIVFCDEPLSSKLLQSSFGLSIRDINNDLKMKIMPSAFIYFHCKEEVLNSRLLGRGKLTLQHSGMKNDYKNVIRESVRAADNIANKLLELGIPGLKINSESNLDVNFKKIEKFLNNLKQNG